MGDQAALGKGSLLTSAPSPGGREKQMPTQSDSSGEMEVQAENFLLSEPPLKK